MTLTHFSLNGKIIMQNEPWLHLPDSLSIFLLKFSIKLFLPSILLTNSSWIVVLAFTSKSWDNETFFGMHGLCSPLTGKLFTSFAFAIGDPKLIGDVCFIATLATPPFFALVFCNHLTLVPFCSHAFYFSCKMNPITLEFSFFVNKDYPSKAQPNCVVSNIWLLINNII